MFVPDHTDEPTPEMEDSDVDFFLLFAFLICITSLSRSVNWSSVFRRLTCNKISFTFNAVGINFVWNEVTKSGYFFCEKHVK